MTYKTISKKAVSKKRKQYALVLSGGGMRGFAQVGALEILLEQGISITAIAGTSIGAIVGVCVAAGKSIDDIKSFFLTLSAFKVLRPKWGAGLLDNKKLVAEVLSFAGVTTFEELLIPMFVNATDINKGKERIFSSGKLQLALQATIAVPGIFSPIQIGKNFYVDGGISHVLPIHLVSKKKNIIAINVALNFEKITSKSSLLSVLDNSILSLQKQSLENMRKDIVLISPRLDEFDFYDYSSKARKAMLRRGRLAAKKALEEL